VEAAERRVYIQIMVQSTKKAPFAPPSADDTLTAEQNTALLQSIARSEAQYQARETIPGKEVFAWLRSWGTKRETAPPVRKSRQV